MSTAIIQGGYASSRASLEPWAEAAGNTFGDAAIFSLTDLKDNPEAMGQFPEGSPVLAHSYGALILGNKAVRSNEFFIFNGPLARIRGSSIPRMLCDVALDELAFTKEMLTRQSLLTMVRRIGSITNFQARTAVELLSDPVHHFRLYDSKGSLTVPNLAQETRKFNPRARIVYCAAGMDRMFPPPQGDVIGVNTTTLVEEATHNSILLRPKEILHAHLEQANSAPVDPTESVERYLGRVAGPAHQV